MASEMHTLRPRTATRYRYRWHSVAFVAVMLILATAAMALHIASSRADPSPLLDEETVAAAHEQALVRLPEGLPMANVDGLQLVLPICRDQLTALGYHAATGDDGGEVVPLEPLGDRLNASILGRGLGSRENGEGQPGYYLMESDAAGEDTGALDVGAPPGTPVYTPVDGVVAGVRSYRLRGECDDVEVRIRPRDQSGLLLVLTHLDNVEVSLGQPVRAGVTRLGAVRKMDGCYRQLLGGFTYDDGNHLHLQVERNLYRAGS